MSALNFRANMKGFIPFLKEIIEDTIEDLSIEDKIYEYRVKGASIVMPKDCTLYVPGKDQ